MYPTKEEIQSLSLQQLSDTYNELIVKIDPDARTIKLFKDRPTGLKRLSGVLIQLHALESDPTASTEAAAPKAKKAKVTKAEANGQDATPKVKRTKKVKEPKERKGARCAGKCLTAAHLIKNPRREGTAGFKSMQIVLENPGILFEDFLAQGGRRKDVTRNLRKGFLKIVEE